MSNKADITEPLTCINVPDGFEMECVTDVMRENQALKAQVNALREAVADIVSNPNGAAIQRHKQVINKTPEKCLAEYRNSVIDEVIITCSLDEYVIKQSLKMASEQ